MAILRYERINQIWVDAKRSNALSKLYRERVDDWSFLKCARAYAKLHGHIRNAKLMRLLKPIIDRLCVHIAEATRRARQALRQIAQTRKFHIGVWGSAGLRGELLRFYLGLKNANMPREILIQLYMS